MTFAVGLSDSPDLLAARAVAEYLGTEHHESVYTAEEAYTGADSFEYRASDGSYATGGLVAFTVEPASDAPDDDSGVFGGCAAGGGSGSPWAVLVLAALVATVHRRRR